MSQDELGEILRVSRERNEREGVTGLLIYRFSPEDQRGNFMQLLEGEAAAVDAAWTRIRADPRHHTKIVLEERELAEREFPDWSMGFRNVEAADLAAFEGYRDLGSEAFWTRARTALLPAALEVMTSFYESA